MSFIPTTIEALETFSKENSNTLLFISFKASWCKPCKEIKPFIDYLKEQYKNVNLNETASIFFVKQTNYLQLIGCLSGEMRIIIAPPNQSDLVKPFINMVSTYDATQLLDKDPIEMNFIEIIVREGNMIYIPYNWIYFIYNNINTECVIVDCINQSLLNYL